MTIQFSIVIAPDTRTWIEKILSRLTLDPNAVLVEIRQIGANVNQAIAKFAADTQAALDAANTALDNIQADEEALAKQIQDLKDAIAAGNSTLTPEDQAALDAITVNATALAARTQARADAVPDAPPPPAV